jgi:hypothetical protein
MYCTLYRIKSLSPIPNGDILEEALEDILEGIWRTSLEDIPGNRPERQRRKLSRAPIENNLEDIPAKHHSNRRTH